MKKVTIRGKVFSGEAVGKLFVNLPWARDQFNEKLGFDPYPGTLNIKLSPKATIEKLRAAKNSIKVKAPEGFYGGRCLRALVGGRIWGAAVVPDVPDYPYDLLEILAPINLRKALGLKNGDMVEVTIWLE